MDFFLESHRQAADKVRQVHILGGLLHVCIRDPLRAQANVAFHGPSKQERVLQHDAESPPQVRQIHLFHINAIDLDRALLHVIEAH